jgi:cytochrome c553
MLRISMAFIPALLSLTAAAADQSAGNTSRGGAKTAACVTCHGADGNGTSDTMPKLAGQVPEYLVKQLRDFRSGRRGNCGGIRPGTQPLSDADITDIATFFSSQRVATTRGTRESPALGEKIYLKGSRSPTFAPACTGCHGPAGGGKANWQQVMTVAPAILPSSIGGQPQRYIASQLAAFRAGSRSNDEGAIMRRLAEKMSDEDIAAVAAYVAGL